MKRILAFAAAALCLTACGAADDGTASSSAAGSSAASSAVSSAVSSAAVTTESSQTEITTTSDEPQRTEKTEPTTADSSSESPEESSKPVTEMTAATERIEPPDTEPPETDEVSADDAVTINGTGYSMTFDLTRWVDVTDQAANVADDSTNAVLEYVFGWLGDGRSSCAIAVTELGADTSGFELDEMLDTLYGQQLPAGQTITDGEIIEINSRQWLKCTFALSAEVFGQDAVSVQYMAFDGTKQLSVSFSIAAESTEAIAEDMAAVMDTVQIG